MSIKQLCELHPHHMQEYHKICFDFDIFLINTFSVYQPKILKMFCKQSEGAIILNQLRYHFNFKTFTFNFHFLLTQYFTFW